MNRSLRSLKGCSTWNSKGFLVMHSFFIVKEDDSFHLWGHSIVSEVYSYKSSAQGNQYAALTTIPHVTVEIGYHLPWLFKTWKVKEHLFGVRILLWEINRCAISHSVQLNEVIHEAVHKPRPSWCMNLFYSLRWNSTCCLLLGVFISLVLLFFFLFMSTGPY